MRDLRGKVVVITGAASGIGLATALRFAREGALVHLVDIDGERLAEALRQVEAVGARARGHVVDCTDPEAVEALAEAVYSEPEGRVDVLHNNAGVCTAGPTEELSLDDWRWTIDINLYGVIHGVKAFLPRMIAQGGGHIVNTASAAGLAAVPMVAPYVASKFAVVGLSEALAMELGAKGVQVTALCPGATRTDVLRSARLKLPGGLGAKLIPGLERRGADPDEIARLVVRAVRREQGLVVPISEMLPLWIFRRLSASLYLRTMRWATTLAARRATR